MTTEEERYEKYKAERDQMTSGRNIILPLFLLLTILLSIISYYFLFYFKPTSDFEVSSSTIIYPLFSWKKESVYRSLDLIEESSPEDYAIVSKYVERIEVAPPIGYFWGRYDIREYKVSTIFIRYGYPKLDPSLGGRYSDEDLIRATVIIHEACHSRQYHEGLGFSEQECYDMHYEFIKNAGPIIWQDFDLEKFSILERRDLIDEALQDLGI